MNQPLLYNDLFLKMNYKNFFINMIENYFIKTKVCFPYIEENFFNQFFFVKELFQIIN